MKYKLINKTTKEEHLCERVVHDGFDYYVSDEKLKVKDKFYFEIDGVSDILEVESEFHLERISEHLENKKVIATNNPNIDIPKVVDVKLLKYKIAEHEYPAGKRERKHTEQEAFINGWNQCLQLQETHSFTEQDMIEFAQFCSDEHCLNDEDKTNIYWDPIFNYGKKYTSKELLQLWKEQQPKIVYYE